MEDNKRHIIDAHFHAISPRGIRAPEGDALIMCDTSVGMPGPVPGELWEEAARMGLLSAGRFLIGGDTVDGIWSLALRWPQALGIGELKIRKLYKGEDIGHGPALLEGIKDIWPSAPVWVHWDIDSPVELGRFIRTCSGLGRPVVLCHYGVPASGPHEAAMVADAALELPWLWLDWSWSCAERSIAPRGPHDRILFGSDANAYGDGAEGWERYAGGNADALARLWRKRPASGIY